MSLIKKLKKKGTVATGIIRGVTIETTFLLLALGTAIFLRIKPLNEINFTDKLSTQMRLTDSTLSAFLEGINNSSLMLKAQVEQGVGNLSLANLETMIVESNSSMKSCAIFKANGSSLCYPDDALDMEFVHDQSWFEDAINNEGVPVFSKLYQKPSGEVNFACAVMIGSDSSSPEGIVILEIDPHAFVSLLGDESTMGDVKFIVLDSESNIILNPFDPYRDAIDHCTTMGLTCLETFHTGDYMRHREVYKGQNTEVRILPSQNEFCVLDYVMLIPVKSINASTNAVLVMVVMLIIISIVLSTGVSFIIAGRITRPLRNLIGILKNISEGDGDLTVRIPETENNELGLLASYFNETIAKIASSMKTVVKESNMMQEVGDRLTESVESSNQELKTISNNINKVMDDVNYQSRGVEVTNNTLNEIASNIQELNENVKIQSDSVMQSSSAIEEMVANIASVTQILDKNSKNVGALTDSAEEGKKIIKKTVEMVAKVLEDSEGLLQATKVIQNIADQTNLLAMNAAIEAAHAGESGKGFAVVAGEIRKLSENSNTQSKKISDVLLNFKEVINAMAKDSNTLAEQFEQIFEHTQTVSTQELVIKNAMDEQTTGSNQVLEAIHKINSITDDVRKSSTDIESGSQKILQQMEKLSNITQGINQSMQDMTGGINSMNETMEMVTKVGRENGECIGRVAEEIGKFKVEETGATCEAGSEVDPETAEANEEDSVMEVPEDKEFFNSAV